MRSLFRKSIAGAPPQERAILDFLIHRKRDSEERSPFGRLKLDLYHGTPASEIDSMLIQGIEPQEHSLLGGDWFCVSPNDNVLRFFGDDGVNGLHAEGVELRHCIFLGKKQTDLFMEVCCGDGPSLDETEDWFARRNVDIGKLRDTDLARAWRWLPKDLEAFVWPNCHEHMIEDHGWSGSYNHEAEISLTAVGCKIFEAAIVHVIRKQEWEEKPTEFQLKLESLEHSFRQAA